MNIYIFFYTYLPLKYFRAGPKDHEQVEQPKKNNYYPVAEIGLY